jgi:hypothetical protein
MFRGNTLKISSHTDSSHRGSAEALGSHAFFRVEENGQKSEPMSKPIEPVVVGAAH